MTAASTLPASAVLETRRLCVQFGGLLALDDVSIRVEPGSIVGLIGPNGAGKTTLFDCVTGLVRADAGCVLLFGQDVTDAPPHRRARARVARTFQRGELFATLSVLDNVTVGVLAASERSREALSVPDARRLAEATIDRVSLSDHAHTKAEDLPLGLARLAELARAVATDPALLLLDEPSSGLRHAEVQRLSALAESMREEGRSLLVVEHDMDFVLGISEHVYVLDFGKLIAQGTPAEIRRDPVVKAAYLGEEIDDAAPA